MIAITEVKGVGVAIAKKLAKLEIHTTQDALLHLPLRYQDRTQITPIANLKLKQEVQIEGVITSAQIKNGRRNSFVVRLDDESGYINLRFYYFSYAQQRAYVVGKQMRCFGEVSQGFSGFEIYHPECLLIHEHTPLNTSLTPIYPTTAGLSHLQIRKIISQVLADYGQDLTPELLPPNITHNLSLFDAISYVHNPPSNADVTQLAQYAHPTQQRIILEELLAHQLAYNKVRTQMRASLAPKLSLSEDLQHKFLASLNFTLTKAQQRVSNEIKQDLVQNLPMLRLVQGDVGSGKTVVAALAALQAISAGYQVALMAPTEILAEQHFLTFKQWFSCLNLEVAFLMSKLKTQEKRQVLAQITQGVPLTIGTHALFQDSVQFAQLGLVIIDEQHRFGVQQRLQLRNKGASHNFVPHQLIMTATPIPRTLTMSIYADLDHSIIDELPPHRTPVTTAVLNNQKREQIIDRVKNACNEGRQVYWVCPLIEESEELNCQAAEITFSELTQLLPTIKIGLVHGRMKADAKKEVMSQFKQGITQILVATTVIEVGVDVPNASLMIIDNAERLGLAQLHQLRGRVGRGSKASFCVLLYQPPLSTISEERLNIMRQTNNGFLIAEKDLELRGPGEILGTKQAGSIQFKVANLIRDNQLLEQAQTAANTIKKHHNDVISPLLNRWLSNADDYLNA